MISTSSKIYLFDLWIFLQTVGRVDLWDIVEISFKTVGVTGIFFSGENVKSLLSSRNNWDKEITFFSFLRVCLCTCAINNHFRGRYMIDCCICDSLLSIRCAEVTKGYLGHTSCVIPFGLGCVVTDLILSDHFVLVCVYALNVYMLVLVHMCAFRVAGRIVMPHTCSPDTIKCSGYITANGCNYVRSILCRHTYCVYWHCLTHLKRVNYAHTITHNIIKRTFPLY